LLDPVIKNGAVLIVSTDFSHYLPLDQAKELDKKTQGALCAGDSGAILSLKNPSQSDCPLCLWILEQEARSLGFWNPFILAHTNSAELLNNLAVKETTSHFAIMFSSDPKMQKCNK
jgi:poly-gamma-glutamate synthesis protein (capsule biosynthesis protein)